MQFFECAYSFNSLAKTLKSIVNQHEFLQMSKLAQWMNIPEIIVAQVQCSQVRDLSRKVGRQLLDLHSAKFQVFQSEKVDYRVKLL